MKPELKTGLRHVQRLTVGDAMTVPALSYAFAGFADMPAVLATAMMVGFIEWACIEALRPHLEAGEATVGTHVDVSHIAPTPSGLNISAEVELIEIRGRMLRFRVSCRDDYDPIGEGFHERMLIDRDKFAARVRAKAGRSARS